MFILGNLLLATAKVLNIVFSIYMWIIIAQAILSWVNPDPYNPIVRFLYNITEPILATVRRYIPVHFGGLDLSPLVIILIIIFLQNFLVSSLIELAIQLKV